MVSGVAWLFCPADRPERFERAAAVADVVILDLEDSVSPDDREGAREALVRSRLDPERTVVRINPAGTLDHERDLDALKSTAYDCLLLAKTETANQASALSPYQVVALCETPRGVLNAMQIADSTNTVGLMWGAEDLIAGLGGRSSRVQHGAYRDVTRHARSTVLLAAGAAGKLAIDSVYLAIGDLDGLAVEAADGFQSGFSAKACIHPTQIATVHNAYRPSGAEVDWARRVLAAAAVHAGVFRLEGMMIDEPVIRQARDVEQRAAGGT